MTGDQVGDTSGCLGRGEMRDVVEDDEPARSDAVGDLAQRYDGGPLVVGPGEIGRASCRERVSYHV